jgi:hypothetical protein
MKSLTAYVEAATMKRARLGLPPEDRTAAERAWQKARRLQSIVEKQIDKRDKQQREEQQAKPGCGHGAGQMPGTVAQAPPESLADHFRRKAFEPYGQPRAAGAQRRPGLHQPGLHANATWV